MKPWSSANSVRINITDEEQDQEETARFKMQVKGKLFAVKGKLLGLCSDLLSFLGIKQIYDLKQSHVNAHALLILMSKEIATLDADQISPNFVDKAIIIAAQQGMTEFIVEIIKANPDLLTASDSDGRDIFQNAIVYRQEKAFSLINGLDALQYYCPDFIDKYRNTILHLAANKTEAAQVRLDQISGAALQMQRELQWFEEVESLVPPGFKAYENDKGETAYQIFDRTHAKLLKEGEQWIKNIAQSSTIVGTLIITITFAALFTVPGGNNQDTGVPLFLTRKAFKSFAISDAISLFASSTSVLMSVGMLTSRYTANDFLKSLPRKLIIALSALFISIAAMMVAFCSAVILIFKGQLDIIIPIVLLAAIPVCLFARLQFPLLVEIYVSTYRPVFDKKMKKWF